MEEISFDEFKSIIHFNKKNKKSLLSGIFHDQFSKYLISYIKDIDKLSLEQIYFNLQNLTFTYKDF